ncbi:MAG: hypothetical protein ACQEVA_18480 [Myxococcota bacterium]
MDRIDASEPLPGARLLPVLVMLAAGLLLPDVAVGQSGGDSKALRACDGYMKLYAQSASRKLARALSGQGYRLETLDLPDTVEADRNGQPTTYETYFEKDKRAAGLVDTSRRARRSFVVVGTQQGPVMTSHQWPARSDIANGTRCRPTSSRIDFPRVAVRSVDVEPFKYWGLRISWHLPESFDDNSTDSDHAFVEEVISRAGHRGQERGGDAAHESSRPETGADEPATTESDTRDAKKTDETSGIDDIEQDDD